jgi:hypothetical protein
MIKIKTITEDLVMFINGIMSSTGRTLNLYPGAAFEGTKIPFMIYRRSNIDDLVSKDGLCNRNLTFDIDIVTNNYNDGVEILDDISEAFYGSSFTGTYTYDVKIFSIMESVDAESGLFIQTITVTISAS